MKRTVEIETLLEFYDVPQLFIAKDKADTRFMCVLYEDEGVCKYLAVRASFDKLNRFMGGGIDLRALILAPELEDEYFIVTFQNNEYEIRSFHGVLKEEMLPEEGYLFSGDWDEYLISRKSHRRSRHNPIAAMF